MRVSMKYCHTHRPHPSRKPTGRPLSPRPWYGEGVLASLRRRRTRGRGGPGVSFDAFADWKLHPWRQEKTRIPRACHLWHLLANAFP